MGITITCPGAIVTERADKLGDNLSDKTCNELISNAQLRNATGLKDPFSRGGKPVRVIWDTGATNTLIPKSVAKNAGLRFEPGEETGKINVEFLNCIERCDTCIVALKFPSDNSIVLNGVEAAIADLPRQEVIIGMDIIMLGDFIFTTSDKKARFSIQAVNDR